MNITDLEKEPPTIDPTPRPHMGRRPVADDYPTRPNASQVVAAAKRQQPSTTPGPRQLLLGVAALAFVVAMVIAGIWQMTRSAPAPLAVPTPAPVQASPAPFSAPPLVEPTQEPTTRQIDAYAAPGGLVLGPIEVDREMRAVAHHGAGWVQANVEGSGLVWLRAADVPTLGLVGPDLAAPVPQTGRGLGQGSSEATPEPPAAPANQQYLNNVGAQTPHCIRTCDGKLGPNGGDWVAVPTLTSQQLEVIGAQAPHKVR